MIASVMVLAGGQAMADTGSFSTFSYNVAGLPQGLSSAAGDRATATKLISCYVKKFSFVNVQEDFNYHAQLYDTCDDHPYRSATSGGAGIGSGLNSLSRFYYDDWDRVKWSACNGTDCLTPKGFTLARVWIAGGVYLDIYNLHTNASTASADLDARRKNILQLLTYIESQSAGNAVLVMGDTNTRYTRDGDNIREFLAHGFTDAWLKLVRNGDIPALGANALVCDPAVTSANCEVVDKVLFRDNGFVGLDVAKYWVAVDTQDANGVELSDHRGVAANWTYSTASNRRLSDQFGGPHGTAYNDVSMLPANPAVRQLKIRTGARVDRVETVLSNGYPFAHGGTGGNEQVLTLADGEYLSAVNMCADTYNGHTRIFQVQFQTNKSRTLSGGTATANCTTYSAPAGMAIVGFHGRSGDALDKLGAIYAPVIAKAAAPVAGTQIVSQKSGLCLDLNKGQAADGAAVQLWACNGGSNQRWSYDDTTGLVRSMADPHYCLDNAGSYAAGAVPVLWTCSGNNNQRFKFDAATGKLALRSLPSLVLDAVGTGNGGAVQASNYAGAASQVWKMAP